MRELKTIIAEYNEIKAKGRKLDMSRGKPAADQLDLSAGLFTIPSEPNWYMNEKGFDCRNYGLLDGTPEAKRIFADVLGTPAENVIIGGSSSLNLMYDTVARAMTHGVCGSKPWAKYEEISFLCPVPGYDRHFAITEHFGVKMINVPMKADGPDMDMIEKLVAADETIKGCWCVPKYSNPDGITYSAEVLKRFATLKPAANDFRVFWDNAYAVHDLVDEGDVLPDILTFAAEYGSEDRFFVFASTAKITYPGAGLSCVAASEANRKWILSAMQFQTICNDKLNQLRHVKFFPDFDALKHHMKKHADLIRPKFALVSEAFEQKLSAYEGVSWTSPKGGYFLTLRLPNGCASRVAKLAAEAGLVLTPAGATHPYGKDAEDSVLRIAPTFPDLAELAAAAELLCVCVELAIADQ